MFEPTHAILPAVFGIASVLYLWLAVRVSRATGDLTSTPISYFLFLAGMLIAGSAFSYPATDPDIYGIGRVLVFFSSGFFPVAIYGIYREYTVGRPHGYTIALLSIVPVCSTVLAATNEMHHLIWSTVEIDGSIRFSRPDDHFWFTRVHAPFAYGLFGYSLVMLIGRLPTIALAHRRKIALLILCTAVPFAVSVGNSLLGIGPIEFPFTASTMSAMLPLAWWLTAELGYQEFMPLAYQTLFDHVRDPIIVLDRSQKIVSANSRAQQLLNASENELVGRRLWDDVPEARSILDHGKDRDLTQTLRMSSGRYFEISSAPLTGRRGQVQGTVVVARDVTERKRVLRALSDSEHLIRSLVEHSSNGILRFARDGDEDPTRFRCTFANRAAQRYLLSGNGTLVGMPLDKIPVLEPGRLTEQFGDPENPPPSVTYEIEIETDTGEVWLKVTGEPVGRDFSVTLVDITQRKKNESKILADALRDPLTGIMNRRGFEKRATESIAAHDRGAVLYLDLNGFKSINDRFGHQAGDALLKAFGHRLEFCLRPEDILARLGGDEFAIVLPGISVEDAKHVAKRLMDSAFEAYIIQGQEITCTASVGIALMPMHGSDLWHLVSVADQAMYNAKHFNREDAANDKAAYIEAAIAS